MPGLPLLLVHGYSVQNDRFMLSLSVWISFSYEWKKEEYFIFLFLAYHFKDLKYFRFANITWVAPHLVNCYSVRKSWFMMSLSLLMLSMSLFILLLSLSLCCHYLFCHCHCLFWHCYCHCLSCHWMLYDILHLMCSSIFNFENETVLRSI